MKDIVVYSAFHRNGELIPLDQIYKPLHVGKKKSKLQLGIMHDANGMNISKKNEIYSELTGWYWIWKNCKHDIVGTAHYRRYFSADKTPLFRSIGKILLFFVGLHKKRHGLFYINNSDNWKNSILSRTEIEFLLCNHDVILPQKKRFKHSVYEQYKRRHKESDIKITKEIISELYPEYLTEFENVFQRKEMYSFNMFIMPWNIFDDYMNWLFTILFELEKRSSIDMQDKYQKRLCAFMAERLQTVWLNKKKLKVKELPVLYFKNLRTDHF